MKYRPRKGKRSSDKVYKGYVGNCRTRNIFFGIPRDLFDALILMNCHYCGRPPANVMEGYWYSGLDRKDNERGYLVKNVVPCCHPCNSIKGNNLTYDEMLKVGKILRTFWKKGKGKTKKK